MAVHKTIYTTNITLVNTPINRLKGTWIITLVDSVDILKTISTTHIIITLFKIIINIIKCAVIFTLLESVDVLKTYPLLTSPLLESKSCWYRVWLFIEQLTSLMSPIFKTPSVTDGVK